MEARENNQWWGVVERGGEIDKPKVSESCSSCKFVK